MIQKLKRKSKRNNRFTTRYHLDDLDDWTQVSIWCPECSRTYPKRKRGKR